MKIELPSDDGANVISIEVFRRGVHEKRLWQECAHVHVTIHHEKATIHCDDCKAELNATTWLSMMVEEWARVERLYRNYVQAKEAYEFKSRCKCEHCGKMTRVKPNLKSVKRNAT